MVEIIPQKPKISLIMPTWRWPLWVSVVLLFLSVGSFVALKVYLAKIQKNIIDIGNEIKTEAAKVSADDEVAVSSLNDSLNTFKDLVKNHAYFSDIFNLIGSLTHSRVVFTKVDIDREKNLIQLKGVAQNYSFLAKQMVAFRENKDVKGLDVKGINFSTSGLDFELQMAVDPKIFIKTE